MLSMLLDINTTILAVAPFLAPAFGFILGMVFASFCCVVIERVPRGESINGRSHCSCGRQLNDWENIPILGWVSSAGRAKCCDARIPAWYVLTETGTAVGWFVLVLALGTPGFFVAAALLGLVTLVVTRMRIRTLRRAA